jgi:hypothetical protein
MRSDVGRTYYSESERNALCTGCATLGHWVAMLSYPAAGGGYYLAFEDWPGAGATPSTWNNDGDFNDQVFLLEGVQTTPCAGGAGGLGGPGGATGGNGGDASGATGGTSGRTGDAGEPGTGGSTAGRSQASGGTGAASTGGSAGGSGGTTSVGSGGDAGRSAAGEGGGPIGSGGSSRPAGSGGTVARGEGGEGGVPDRDDDEDDGRKRGGCGCRTVGSRVPGGVAWLGALGLTLVARRGRDRRRRPRGRRADPE